MDDGWASPWAEDFAVKSAKPDGESIGSAPVKQPTLPEGLGNTWTGEDGFDEWAPLPARSGGPWLEIGVAQKSETGIDNGVDWGTADAEDSGGVLDQGGKSMDNGPRLMAEDGLSMPTPSSSTLPPPSPDPWASRMPSDTDEVHVVEGDTLSGHLHDEVADDPITEDHLQDHLVQEDAGPQTGGVDLDPPDIPSFLDSLDEDDLHPPEPAIGRIDGTACYGVSPDGSLIALNLPELPSGPDSEEPHLSRPSSFRSDYSHHNGIMDSPRTSFEDEISHSPSKDQESQGHPIMEPCDRAIGMQSNVDATDEVADTGAARAGDDLGDFGEHFLGISKVEAPAGKDSIISDMYTSHNNNISSSQDHLEKTLALSSSLAENYQLLSVQSISSLIQDLYNTPTQSPEPAMPWSAITATTPFGDFTTTSQRKTWHRISRYGSVRQHDNDNYARISWKQSEVRNETNKIVARWMREDRMRGGVTIGQGKRLSSLFGWGEDGGRDLASFGPGTRGGAAAGTASGDAAKPPASGASEGSPQTPGSRIQELLADSSNVAAVAQKHVKSPSPLPQFGWSIPSPDPSAGETDPRSHQRTASQPTALKHIHHPINHQRHKTVIAPSMAMCPSTGNAFSPVPSPLPASSPNLASNLNSTTSPPLTSHASSQDTAAPLDPWSLLATAPASNPATVTTGVQPHDALLSPEPILSTEDDDEWGEMVDSVAALPAIIHTPAIHIDSRLQGSRGHKSSMSHNFGPQSALKYPSAPRHRASVSWHDQLVPAMTKVPASASVDDQQVSSIHDPMSTPAEPGAAFNSPALVPGHGDISLDQSPTTNEAFLPSDVWASADFSIFDAPPPSSPLPRTSTEPTHSAAATDTILKTPIVPEQRRPSAKSAAERTVDEENRIVREIVKGLPDLSYMLRR